MCGSCDGNACINAGEAADSADGRQHNAAGRGDRRAAGGAQAGRDAAGEPALPAARGAVPRPGPVEPRRHRLFHQGRHREPADAAQPVQGQPQGTRPQKARAGTRAGCQDAQSVHRRDRGDGHATQHASQLLLTAPLFSSHNFHQQHLTLT